MRLRARLITRLARRLATHTLRTRSASVVVLALCSGLFVAFLAIPVLYRGVIADSARVSLAGHTYSTTFRPDATTVAQGYPQLRATQTQTGTVRTSGGLSAVTVRSSNDPDFVAQFGITQDATATPSSGLAVSRALAQTVGAEPGDPVRVEIDGGGVVEGTVGRVFVLPADPDTQIVVVVAPVAGDGLTYTSADNPFRTILRDGDGDGVIRAISADLQGELLTESTVPPRLVDVSIYGFAIVGLLAVAWAGVAGAAGRMAARQSEAGLIRSGASLTQAQLVVGGASALSTGASVAVGGVLGVAALWVAAPAVGNAMGQVWLRSRVFSSAMVGPDAARWVVVFVIAVFGVSVAAALIRAPRRLTRWPVIASGVLGTVLLGAATVMLGYLWWTQGPVPGWFIVGAVVPVTAAIGAALLATAVVGHRPKATSGLGTLRTAMTTALAPTILVCVILATGVTTISGSLVTDSVWGNRNNPPIAAGGYLEFDSVTSSQREAMQVQVADYPNLTISAAASVEFIRILAVPPSAAACYKQARGTDAGYGECDPGYPVQSYVGLPTDEQVNVRAFPAFVEDGEVALVLVSPDFMIDRVVVRDAVPDAGLGGPYLPGATLPTQDPLIDQAGLVPDGNYVLRVAGLDTIPQREYLALRGQLALLAPASVFAEDVGYDDGGNYFAGVMIATLGAILATAGVVALVQTLTRERRLWWPIVLGLRMPYRRRAALIATLVAPVVIGCLVGSIVAGFALAWMVDDSPILDSRLVFALPGLVALLLTAGVTWRLTRSQ